MCAQSLEKVDLCTRSSVPMMRAHMHVYECQGHGQMHRRSRNTGRNGHLTPLRVRSDLRHGRCGAALALAVQRAPRDNGLGGQGR